PRRGRLSMQRPAGPRRPLPFPTRRPADLLTAVVTVADDGGSSGRLRRDLGVLPPGDLRMALAALCGDDDWGRTWARVLQHRFSGDRKSTRLNSSHVNTSYAVFCLKTKRID